MRQLERALGKLLRGAAVRRPDTQRSAREKSNSLIDRHKIELEKLRDGGFNVWGLRDLEDALDPYHGDHHANDWAEVLPMVEAYARIAEARQT